MSTEGELVGCSRASCKNCSCGFQMPLLNDFSYGRFIFYGRGIYGYLNGVTESAWDDIGTRLLDHQSMSNMPSTDQVGLMQKVVAALADPLGGQKLASHPVCLHCGSRDVAYGDLLSGEPGSLPAVTFTAYGRMSDEQRNLAISAIWKECAVQPPDDNGLAGKAPAFSQIFAVLRDFHVDCGTDIRLGSLAALFEHGAATRAEVDWAIEYMLKKKWLIENRQPGVRPGGHCLSEAGKAAMINWPLTQMTPI